MGCRKVLIIANLMKDDAGGRAREISSYLATLDIASSTFGFKGPTGQFPSAEGIDLVISLGGDGTVLFAARVAAPSGVPILPFNLGRLGFIAGFGRDDWRVALDAWLSGHIGLSARTMLLVSVKRGGTDIGAYVALNDGVVSGNGIAKLLSVEMQAGGSDLGEYRADGIIVSTPTGSTAYNLAAGGPIVHPEMDAMILNPVCPFTLSNRPIVVPGSETIEILVGETKRTGIILTVDGQEVVGLEAGDRVSFVHAPRRALIYTPERQSFYEVLRNKLSWSGGADD